MTNVSSQAVLDLTILTDMYGDDSAQTVCQALSGFRSEAKIYVGQLQQATAEQQYAEIGRLSHSLKSMCGLIGASQLMMLCLTTEQAARRCDAATLKTCGLELATVWPALLLRLESSLGHYGHLSA